MTNFPQRRGFTVVPGGHTRELVRETRQVRDDAVARYTEVDLLVAALREHIEDLRDERDRLLDENAHLRSRIEEMQQTSEAAAAARWLTTRSKSIRT